MKSRNQPADRSSNLVIVRAPPSLKPRPAALSHCRLSDSLADVSFNHVADLDVTVILQ